jgi:uncharacterized SAM-binding protein YcdF (DUF218 family)
VLSFLVVLLVSRLDQRYDADAIVVLGAAQYDGRPSPVFRARLDHAALLYREGYAGLLVVTGGIVAGDRMSEATAGRRYLVQAGVATDDIAVAAEGRSTAESVEAVSEMLGGDAVQRVILVSDPFHLARLRLEARRVGLAAYTSPTRTSPISERLGTEVRYLLAEAAKLPVILLWSLAS